MTNARWLLLAALLAPLPAAALDQPACLSQSEVKGSHLRYHLIDGRQCWYAATSPAAKPAAAQTDVAKPDVAKPDVAKPDVAKPEIAKSDAGAPTAAADGIEVDPYGDPIWQQAEAHEANGSHEGHSAPRKPRRAKPSAVGGPLILNPSSAYAR
ncbi:MAG: hypothetical protein ABSG76_26320 [Xanthobacteraceae bacterium]